jgi:hypothetical protein
MWSIIKDAVYARRARNVEHMKPVIGTEFTKLHMNQDLCSAICHSVVEQGILYLQLMMDTDSEQFLQ